MRVGYMLAGLPAAGKSTVAEIIADETGGDIIHAGEIIREMWHDEHDGDPTSDDLGTFAAEKRGELGDGFFAEYLVGDLLRGGEDRYQQPLIIDSVRHINGVNELREYFTTSHLLWVSASFDKRFERIKARGRDDEGDFTEVDLLERDERELYDLGVNTIYSREDGVVDRYIDNSQDEDTLRNRLRNTVISDAHKQ